MILRNYNYENIKRWVENDVHEKIRPDEILFLRLMTKKLLSVNRIEEEYYKRKKEDLVRTDTLFYYIAVVQFKKKYRKGILDFALRNRLYINYFYLTEYKEKLKYSKYDFFKYKEKIYTDDTIQDLLPDMIKILDSRKLKSFLKNIDFPMSSLSSSVVVLSDEIKNTSTEIYQLSKLVDVLTKEIRRVEKKKIKEFEK